MTVPSLGRVLIAMQIGRIAQSMVGVVLVLFAFQRYNSPALAGLVTFAALVPGLVVSPIAGALLDRHGRTRLVMLDYAVAAGAMILIATLALASSLPGWLLVVIAAASGLTAPLSNTGLRSLFPLLVPKHLWERVNAVDSNGWVLATVVGGPAAGILTQYVGFEPTLYAMAVTFGLACVLLVFTADPHTETVSTGNLFLDAWQGLVYTWHNPALRGLAIGLSTFNISLGMLEIFLPATVLHRLGMGQSVVGILFGVQGLFGMLAALLAGRIRSEGRERQMVGLPMIAIGAVMLLFLLPGSVAPLVVAMALNGFLQGPMDIGLFTLRQRVTDPAWMGRAFAVSMNLNLAGFPIGAALAGAIVQGSAGGADSATVSTSIAIAVLVATAGCILAAIFSLTLVPAQKPQSDSATEPAKA